jgi:chromosome partitioning protein
MLVISFVTTKGGAGKSTLAFSTGVAAMQAGQSVAILDLDPQNSAVFWSKARKRADLFVESVELDAVSNRIAELSTAGFSLCILDTPGSGAIAEPAVLASHVCLIPARPNVFDLRAGETTRRMIRDMGKTAVFLLNQCPPMRQSARVQDGVRALESSGVLISPVISARVDFQDAARAGLGVTELNPSGPAAQEIRDLWAAIEKLAVPDAPGDFAQAA